MFHLSFFYLYPPPPNADSVSKKFSTLLFSVLHMELWTGNIFNVFLTFFHDVYFALVQVNLFISVPRPSEVHL